MKKLLTIKRWNVLKKLIDGEITINEASLQLGVSYRQTIRMKQSVLQNGVRGLIHGNTGRKPSNAVAEEVKTTILEWSRNGYGGLSDIDLAEALLKKGGVKVSRETVRKIRRSGGVLPGKANRQPRQTAGAGKPREGYILFWDGMIHQWFASMAYPCCLIVVIDDATGRCVQAKFFPFEESFAYLWVLKMVVGQYGIPEKIIQDRNPLLMRSDKEWSIEEELRGEQDPTQIGCALKEFDIEPVYLATKRQQRCFERIFELFHIRLIEKIQQEQITEIQGGNTFLDGFFIEDFNRTYAIQSEAVDKRWRPAPSQKDLDRICSFRYKARLKPEGIVQIGDLVIKLDMDTRLMVHRKSVDVRQMLDGSWSVYDGAFTVGGHPPTPLREPIRQKQRPHDKTVRDDNCAWTYPQ